MGRATSTAFAAEGGQLHLATRKTGTVEVLAIPLRSDHGVATELHTVELRASEDQQRLASETSGADTS